MELLTVDFQCSFLGTHRRHTSVCFSITNIIHNKASCSIPHWHRHTHTHTHVQQKYQFNSFSDLAFVLGKAHAPGSQRHVPSPWGEGFSSPSFFPQSHLQLGLPAAHCVCEGCGSRMTGMPSGWVGPWQTRLLGGGGDQRSPGIRRAPCLSSSLVLLEELVPGWRRGHSDPRMLKFPV